MSLENKNHVKILKFKILWHERGGWDKLQRDGAGTLGYPREPYTNKLTDSDLEHFLSLQDLSIDK